MTGATTSGRVRRFTTAHPMAVDGAQAVVFATCGLLLTATAYSAEPQPDLAERYAATWQVAAVAVLVYLPLFARRRTPLTTLAVVSLGYCLHSLWLVPESIFVSVALFLALYSVGDLSPRPTATYARGASIALLTLFEAVLLTGQLVDVYGATLSLVQWLAVNVMNVVFFGAAWRLGDAARERREREDLLAQRNRELEAERAENARRAVLDERVRIARELHDVVAHSVSVMGIQAGAARRVLATDPLAATAALGSIEQSSRSAVVELQRLLGLLRQEDRDDGPERAPQPGVDRLGALIDEAAAAGLRTDFTIEGDPRDLPSGLAVSVYRIVQEALTNTLRHAGARAVEVQLRYAEDALDVEVLDDGRGPDPRAAPPRPGRSGGHGLLGMRERAALHRGRLEAGARPGGGGYRVHAHLPLLDTDRALRDQDLENAR